jgi:hypothetical protein
VGEHTCQQEQLEMWWGCMTRLKKIREPADVAHGLFLSLDVEQHVSRVQLRKQLFQLAFDLGHAARWFHLDVK